MPKQKPLYFNPLVSYSSETSLVLQALYVTPDGLDDDMPDVTVDESSTGDCADEIMKNFIEYCIDYNRRAIAHAEIEGIDSSHIILFDFDELKDTLESWRDDVNNLVDYAAQVIQERKADLYR